MIMVIAPASNMIQYILHLFSTTICKEVPAIVEVQAKIAKKDI